MIYDLGLPESTKFLEEWLITELIQPFFSFISKIKSKLPQNATQNDIMDTINNYLSVDVADKTIKEYLEDLAEFLTNIWF